MTDHRAIAEAILADPDSTLEDYIRAVAHAKLAATPPLHYDAYSPGGNVTQPESKPSPPQLPTPESSQTAARLGEQLQDQIE